MVVGSERGSVGLWVGELVVWWREGEGRGRWELTDLVVFSEPDQAEADGGHACVAE